MLTRRSRADRLARRGSVVFAGAVGLAALGSASIGALGERGIAVVHHCVSGSGAFGWWGTRLAMVRHSDVCPEGSLALGGAPDDVAGVIAAVAIPVVVLHVLGALAALGWGRYLRSSFRALGALARPLTFWRERARVVVPVLGARVRVVVARPVARARALLLARARVLRGPPPAFA